MNEQQHSGAEEKTQRHTHSTNDTLGSLSYLQILYEWKWFILVVTVSVVALVAIGNQFITPRYTVETTVRVLTPSSGTSPWETYNVGHADRVLQTYVEYARSRPVLEELQRRTGFGSLPEIDVEHVALTELIVITVESTDAHKAAFIANSMAELLIDHSIRLYSGGSTTASEILSQRLAALEERIDTGWREHSELVDSAEQPEEIVLANEHKLESLEELYTLLLNRYEENLAKELYQANMISVIEQADPGEASVKPDKQMNLLLAALIGLLGGAGMAYIFESLDPVLYTTNQISALTALPVLGKIPHIGKAKPHKLFETQAHRDAFQRLRATLFNTNHSDRPLQTLIVSSAEPAEGKSTIAANLAVALAQRGKHVALIDADLHHPALHKFFDLTNDVGLSSVLEQNTSLDDALKKDATFGISVLLGGPDGSEQASSLDSDSMYAILDHLKQRFDVILIDTPAFLPVAAGAQLAPKADGVLLVAACARVRREAMRATHQQLRDIDAKLLGVIVNRTRPEPGYYHYYR